MKIQRLFLAVGLLAWTVPTMAAKEVSPLPLILVQVYEGALPVGAPVPGDNPSTPAPQLVRDATGWDKFLLRLPSKVPGGNVMGKMVDNNDPVRELQLDFSRQSVVILAQGSSREGSLRYLAASPEGKTLTVMTETINLGGESRPIGLGFYTALVLTGVPNGVSVVQHQTKLVKPAVTVRLVEDPTTELAGLQDAKGAWIVKPRWSQAQDFDRWGHATVYETGLGYLMIDTAGQTVLKVQPFDNGPDYFMDGYARCLGKDNKIGYFDLLGKIAIAPQFDYAEPFENGSAVVGRGGKYVQDGEHSLYKGGQFNHIDQTGRLTGVWK